MESLMKVILRGSETIRLHMSAAKTLSGTLLKID
jgi:hypothetical protein